MTVVRKVESEKIEKSMSAFNSDGEELEIQKNRAKQRTNLF